ncbi:IucA/IucC family protein [Azospirillum sp. SYSU D00513]|uniref:IucA/IucC family protein n=1 Tax=Azospirillum sp. SYSU D00513 TaxID=2812561 RepID=UPI001B3BADA6|nr:IucA/IucC family protein [Azospirillum sp. SYSU D00513]
MPFPLDLPGRPDERVARQLAAALLFEELVTARITGEGDALLFHWVVGRRDFRCRGRQGPFGRLRILPGSVETRSGLGLWEAADHRALLEGLPVPEAHKAALLAELDRTVALCRWNDANLPLRMRRGLVGESRGYAELEGALEEGHPYHPCFKARLGFSEDDHAAFGPEAGQEFQLVWLLVARAHLRQALPGDESRFWRAELGEAVWQEIEERRAMLGLDAEAFGLLPLHPWQWEDLRQGGLAGWLADGRAHALGPLGDRYRASQSLRTVMNADDPRKADVKLAMNIVNTASRRIIVPHSVCTAPVISHWLTGIVAADADFEHRYPLTLLPEYAGIIADRDGPLAGQMAVLWRRSVTAALREGEGAVPFNLLAVTEPDGDAFIAGWVERFGLDAWLDRLIEVAVLPVWHLLVCHGVAVEAHGQNMVLVHRDGWPARLILRDFHDSVEYEPGFLRDPTAVPPFRDMDDEYRDGLPNQYYWADTVDALRELVMDTLFVYNMTDLSHLIEHRYGLPERTFWEKVHRCLERYARRHGLAERQALVGHRAERLLAESLLTEKLLNARTELHHSIPNVFAEFPA